MREMERIADLLTRAGDGDAWHGPSIAALLVGVSAARAAERPIAGGHSIWEIVLHIGVWERVVVRRLGGDAFDPSSEEDWQPVGEPSEERWRAALARLSESRAELRRALLAFDETRLGETVQGKSYSFYVMAHGIVQHDLYHAGQIALLRKALA